MGRLRRCGILTASFKARTASLCSHISADAVNNTQRTGTECLAANSIHLLRTSESALVLSVQCQNVIFQNAVQVDNGYIPTHTDFPLSKYSPATLIHFSRFRVSVTTHGILHERITHCFQSVLIDSFESERLELFPVKRGFSSARTTAEQNDFLGIFLEIDLGC